MTFKISVMQNSLSKCRTKTSLKLMRFLSLTAIPVAAFTTDSIKQADLTNDNLESFRNGKITGNFCGVKNLFSRGWNLFRNTAVARKVKSLWSILNGEAARLKRTEKKRLEIDEKIEGKARLQIDEIVEEKARQEIKKKSRLTKQEKARLEIEEKERLEILEKERLEREEKRRLKIEEKARQEIEEKARQEREEKARQEIEEKKRLEIEEKILEMDKLAVKETYKLMEKIRERCMDEREKLFVSNPTSYELIVVLIDTMERTRKQVLEMEVELNLLAELSVAKKFVDEPIESIKNRLKEFPTGILEGVKNLGIDFADLPFKNNKSDLFCLLNELKKLELASFGYYHGGYLHLKGYKMGSYTSNKFN